MNVGRGTEPQEPILLESFLIVGKFRKFLSKENCEGVATEGGDEPRESVMSWRQI